MRKHLKGMWTFWTSFFSLRGCGKFLLYIKNSFLSVYGAAFFSNTRWFNSDRFDPPSLEGHLYKGSLPHAKQRITPGGVETCFEKVPGFQSFTVPPENFKLFSNKIKWFKFRFASNISLFEWVFVPFQWGPNSFMIRLKVGRLGPKDLGYFGHGIYGWCQLPGTNALGWRGEGPGLVLELVGEFGASEKWWWLGNGGWDGTYLKMNGVEWGWM